MFRNKLSKRIDGLSVVARQCIAAVCFERYCVIHNLKHPDIRAFIDHIWGIGAIQNPEQFEAWELGFQGLKASGWGDPLPDDLLEIIPPYERSMRSWPTTSFETSATTWYGSDIKGTREYLIKVIHIVSKYGIELPNFDRFKSSSPELNGGWGSTPPPNELYAWRYDF